VRSFKRRSGQNTSTGLKSYLSGLKACGVTPNLHTKKENHFRKRITKWEPLLHTKKENHFRKRVAQWEPLPLCYLSEGLLSF
jgi:hypothetical protein